MKFAPDGTCWDLIEALDDDEMSKDVAANDELHDLDCCDELRHWTRRLDLQRANAKVAEVFFELVNGLFGIVVDFHLHSMTL